MEKKIIIFKFTVPWLASILIANVMNAQISTPQQGVDALHNAFGNNNARAVHAKGIILEGIFKPSKESSSLTKAIHLQKVPSKAIIRFSDFTGIPSIPDNIPGANPRGMAIKFITQNGQTTDIVMHSFNGFPTSNQDEFIELLNSIATSKNANVKPTPIESFLESHPIAKTFLTTQKCPASFATISYFGVNSFKFTNKNNQSQYIRYQFVPHDGENFITESQMQQMDKDYLMNEIKKRIKEKKPIKFDVFAQIAVEGDVIENPSIAWPESRKRILLGVVEIEKLASNTVADDKALSFSPTNITDGIEIADPMLNYRGKAYPISVKERQ